MGLILSLAAGVIPMVIYAAVLTWFDRYEKEPPLLLAGVFLWGALVAAGAALIINTLFDVGLIFATGSETAASIGTSVLVAPFVEETVKGLGVVAVFAYFYREFDSLLDGVLYGSLVGFGFAAAENVNYIFFSGFAVSGLEGLLVNAIVRVVVVAFLHATLTACTGIGLAVARLNRGWLRYAAPLLGYGTAVFLHAFHNGLASLGSTALCLLGSAIDWLGFVGLFIFILALVWREGRIMQEHLREEVQAGLLTPVQYRAACSLTGQFTARWGALGRGRFRQAGQLYDKCGELAFKKYQLARVGAERETHGAVDILRGEIGALSKAV